MIEHDYDVAQNESDIEEGSNAEVEEYEQEVYTNDKDDDHDEENEEDEDEEIMNVEDHDDTTNPGQGGFFTGKLESSPCLLLLTPHPVAPAIKYFLASAQNASMSLSRLSVDVFVEVRLAGTS